MCEDLVKRLRARADREDDYYEHGGDIINEAASAIEELIRQNKKWEEAVKTALDFIPCWVPVTERMPEILNTVIVYGRMRYKWEADYFRFVDAAVYTEEGIFETFHDWYEGQDVFEITHWQPLPELPKEVLRDGNAQT